MHLLQRRPGSRGWAVRGEGVQGRGGLPQPTQADLGTILNTSCHGTHGRCAHPPPPSPPPPPQPRFLTWTNPVSLQACHVRRMHGAQGPVTLQYRLGSSAAEVPTSTRITRPTATRGCMASLTSQFGCRHVDNIHSKNAGVSVTGLSSCLRLLAGLVQAWPTVPPTPDHFSLLKGGFPSGEHRPRLPLPAMHPTATS